MSVKSAMVGTSCILFIGLGVIESKDSVELSYSLIVVAQCWIHHSVSIAKRDWNKLSETDVVNKKSITTVVSFFELRG